MPFAELGQAQPESWSQWLRRFSPEYNLPPAGSMPQYPGLRQAPAMGPMEFFFTHQPVWENATRLPPMKSWPGINPGPPAQTPEDRAMEMATMLFGLASGGAAASVRGVPEIFAGQVPPRPGFTRLWRAEGIPNPELQGIVSPALEWLRDDPDFQSMQRASGRWWAYNPEETWWYAKHRGDWSGIGAQIRHLDVPSEIAEQSRVSNLPPGHHARLFSRRPEQEAFLPQKPSATTPTPLYQGPVGPLRPYKMDQPWQPEKPSGTLREQATKLLKSERGAVGPKKPGYYDSLRGRWITPETGYDPLTGRRTPPKASEPTQQKIDPLLGRRPREEQGQVPATPPPPRKSELGSLTPSEKAELEALEQRGTGGLYGADLAKAMDRLYELRGRAAGIRPAIAPSPPPTPGALHDPLAGLSPQDAAAIQQKLVGGQSEPFAGTPFGRQYEYDPKVKYTQEVVPEFPSALTQQSGLAGAFGPVGEGAGTPSTPGALSSRFAAPELDAVYALWESLDRRGHTAGVGSFVQREIEEGLTSLSQRVQAGQTLTPELIAADLTDSLAANLPEIDWPSRYEGILSQVRGMLRSKPGRKR